MAPYMADYGLFDVCRHSCGEQVLGCFLCAFLAGALPSPVEKGGRRGESSGSWNRDLCAVYFDYRICAGGWCTEARATVASVRDSGGHDPLRPTRPTKSCDGASSRWCEARRPLGNRRLCQIERASCRE